MTSHKPGILLVFEGIDGAGKTTQAMQLAESLRMAGETVVQSKEPTEGQWGRRIRQSAQDGRMELSEELDLFLRDRREHMIELVQPALAQGSVVILDRYFYSTIAYQGARGANYLELERRMSDEFPRPDLVLLIDVLPQVGLERISVGRGESPNHFERSDTLASVRHIFLEVAQRDKTISIVDGHRDAASVFQDILRITIDTALKAKRCGKSYGCDYLYCSLRANGECQWAELRQKLEQPNQPLATSFFH